MKSSLIAVFLFLPLPSYANNYYSNYSQGSKCYKNVYREKYVPGNASNPGYIRKWEERVEVNCNNNGYAQSRNNSNNYYSNNKSLRCERSTMGSLLGGGLAAALSAVDAYGWSIPLGAVLGSGIANNTCN
tara:strand:- start:418 stop:807 length:390 start_codon:yes stop_codon:yes gene_type:complete